MVALGKATNINKQMFKTIIYIAIGGAIGSVFRYLISVKINKIWLHSFPLATFLINILGCFILGIIIGFLDKQEIVNANFKWFLITGFCGGFTTFSTFSLESVNLIENENSLLALLYICLSIFIGLLSIWMGLSIVKYFDL